MKKPVALAATLLLAVPVAACGDDGDSTDGGSDRTTLTVFAAASLTTSL